MKIFNITGSAVIYPRQKAEIEMTKLNLRGEATDALNSGIVSLLKDYFMSRSEVEVINIETIDEKIETIGSDVRSGSISLCAYIRIPEYAYKDIMKEGKIYDIKHVL